jgi:hypothetical protein
MVIGIPVRTAPCASTRIWTTIDSFLVRERFLFFTHTLTMPFTPEGGYLIMHSPGGHQGEPNVVCASP